MGETRLFASLSSGLLARKGEARPAMRPQLASPAADDLGWNDMGDPARVTPPVVLASPPPVPAVVQQQEAIAEEFGQASVAVIEAGPVVAVDAVPPVRSRTGGKAKAAFTLRLDPQRHLRLRLACALSHRSAQAVVTQALDTLLDSLPEIDAAAHAAARR